MAVYANLSFCGWVFLLFLLDGQKKKLTKRKTAASKLRPDSLSTDQELKHRFLN